MTPQQIALVRSSFARMRPIAPQAAALFYDRLFERDPTLGSLFHVDMAQQGARLMHMIEGAVSLLDRPAVLSDTLLRLGDTFTAETREAWATMYGHVAETMPRGAIHGSLRAVA